MVSHLRLAEANYPVISFGTGSLVRLPGPSITQPNVYHFNKTSYDSIYRELQSKDPKLYVQNGVLNMVDRNRNVKWGPERWQDWQVGMPRLDKPDDRGSQGVEGGIVDIVITSEERCWDAVIDDLMARGAPMNRPVHVINVDIKDNHEEASVGGRAILDLANTLNAAATEARQAAGAANFDSGSAGARASFDEQFIYLDQQKRRQGMDAEQWRMSMINNPLLPQRGLTGRHRGSIKRGQEFDDAFEQFFELGESLKEPVQIQFIDSFGDVEAGIDGGGVAKEFLLSAINQVFMNQSEDRYFVENSQKLWYPNPIIFDKSREEAEEMGFPEARKKEILTELSQKYEFLGRLVGKCMYEDILIDVNFAGFFLLKWAASGLTGEESYRGNVNDLRDLDAGLYQGLVHLKNLPADEVESLSLDFTVDDQISADGETVRSLTRELIPGRGSTPVTKDNRLLYISYMARHRLVVQPAQQTMAFLRGLRAIIAPTWLSMFNQIELQRLVGGDSSEISIDDLRANTNYSGLYVIGDDGEEHPTIQLFWKVVRGFTDAQRRDLLKYVTSTPLDDQISADGETVRSLTRELIPGRGSTPVTKDNRLLYISYMARHRLVVQPAQQTMAFLRGLRAIIAPTWLSMFNQTELQRLVGGDSSEISIDDLRANTNYSGLYVIGDDGEEHPTIQLFWKVVRGFTDAQRRDLLKYVTSTPRAPLLGFGSLNPLFSIRDGGTDEARLPSASTCVNLLKLPRYTDEETLRRKLVLAISAGAGFDLS
ncbi:hypothetical protein BN1723_012601 [Verticillium longisporum]|uniref:Suppressor of SUA7 protein 2 homolog n=1 Tax=Verticillium longisporum TaxID=100787 RepID=A0A0G4LJR2_VERLO|nr:hypothetical protein BN1723_012601 [Verticillium longisporum]